MNSQTDLTKTLSDLTVSLFPAAERILNTTPGFMKNNFRGVSIRTIPEDKWVNGHVTYYGDEFHISINHSLLRYYTQSAMLFSTRSHLVESPGMTFGQGSLEELKPQIEEVLKKYKIHKSGVSFHQEAQIFGRLLRNFAEGESSAIDLFESFEAFKGWHLALVNIYLEYILKFVAGHEIGHVLVHIGKKDPQADRLRAYREMADTYATHVVSNYLKGAKHESSSLKVSIPANLSAPQVISHWIDEFLADVVAVLLITLTEEQKAPGSREEQAARRQLAFMCVGHALATSKMIDKYVLERRGIGALPFDTHPFYEDRLAFLRSLSDKNVLPASQADSFEFWEKQNRSLLAEITTQEQKARSFEGEYQKAGERDLFKVDNSELEKENIKLGTLAEYTYGIVGLIVGLSVLLLGAMLAVSAVQGADSIVVRFLGFESRAANATAGTVFCVIGVVIIRITVPRVILKKLRVGKKSRKQ